MLIAGLQFSLEVGMRSGEWRSVRAAWLHFPRLPFNILRRLSTTHIIQCQLLVLRAVVLIDKSSLDVTPDQIVSH